ncbi:MAG: ATP-dependent Clp protease ATP-binding subunit ClpB, partial [Blastocatellia bacterium]|nr:ATP-dependent Clp protease ATP-binding subunit ClpB [Blastocatellia bacterium]
MIKTKRTPVATWLITATVLVSMCASLTFSQRAKAQFEKKTQSESRSASDPKYPTLSRYATDLTLLALGGKIEPSSEPGVANVIASLANTTKAPLVISDSDLNRDAIARGVAYRIAFGNVPETLRTKHVFRLSLEALAKGALTSDEFSRRVQAVFTEAAQAQGRIILFVDHMQQYAGASATSVASAT